jgi:hypothetical protein
MGFITILNLLFDSMTSLTDNNSFAVELARIPKAPLVVVLSGVKLKEYMSVHRLTWRNGDSELRDKAGCGE